MPSPVANIHMVLFKLSFEKQKHRRGNRLQLHLQQGGARMTWKGDDFADVARSAEEQQQPLEAHAEP